MKMENIKMYSNYFKIWNINKNYNSIITKNNTNPTTCMAVCASLYTCEWKSKTPYCMCHSLLGFYLYSRKCICWWGCRHFPIGLSSAVPDSGIFDLRCDWPPQRGYRRGHAGTNPTSEEYKTTYIWHYRIHVLCVQPVTVYCNTEAHYCKSLLFQSNYQGNI